MAKAFSILLWNVEHFGAKDKNKKNPKKPIAPIVAEIAKMKPDILAVIEVRSALVAAPLMASMPDHFFFITEGDQMQEILVGIRKTLPAFTTQKTEFKAGQNSLRPGLLITPVVDGQAYPLLFLHVKSLRDPKGFGLRQDMIKRAFDFRKTIGKALGTQRPNYMFLGDLNTMGFDYYGSDKDLDGDREIQELSKAAARRNMRVLSKTHDKTYWSERYGQSDLDHVVAMDHLKFKKFSNAEVQVSGWNDLSSGKSAKELDRKIFRSLDALSRSSESLAPPELGFPFLALFISDFAEQIIRHLEGMARRQARHCLVDPVRPSGILWQLQGC